MAYVHSLVGLLVGWIVSTIAVWIALKIYPGRQKNESLAGAAVTALVGALIFWFFRAVVGIPLIGGILALLVWLYVLRKLQGVGWLGAAALALLIWLINGLLGLFLPTIL
ncbi:hypothetical protein TUZN_1047 [Thermoproteus uzoniensis 768-20]|uniref:Uncharacterized protein n=1 Tax=Thermoproteus uzoniensis (strain 768-20) TaxID=999630 RepID=F2L6D2_THEU7|nr:hypothetical protein [Thermoproteus uzoniensis]AEA12528.1 hypothetical protein TUZN_1047 [Thermoproteus uzoniensis 768-20]